MLLVFLFSCRQDDNANNPDPDTKDSTKVEDPKWPENVELTFETLFEGWQNPWGIAFIDSYNIVITEREGACYLFKEQTGERKPIEGLQDIAVNGQGGLLDVQAHPDFNENKWLYFTYAKNVLGGGNNTALARAELNGTMLTNWEVLYEATPGTNNSTHFGSRIVFDQEYLYMSLGERGVPANAQNTANANGSVIRLFHNGSVPPNNPFVNDNLVLNEIYTYGHRNPQGMALNKQTGKIWLHEHGPRGGDEINILEPAANYGWPLVTFGLNYDGTTISKDTIAAGITPPIHYWTPSIAPCGMAFFEHPRYGQYNNQLLVGALAHRKLQVCFLDGERVKKTEDHLVNLARFRDVKFSPNGYMYAISESTGLLIKIVPKEI